MLLLLSAVFAEPCRVDSPNWYSCSSNIGVLVHDLRPPPSATPLHSLLCNCHSDLTDPTFPLIWSVLIETQILLVHFLHNCAWWQSPWAACRTRSLISTCIQVYLHLTSKIKYTCPPLECSIFFTRHFHISQTLNLWQEKPPKNLICHRCYFHFRLIIFNMRTSQISVMFISHS